MTSTYSFNVSDVDDCPTTLHIVRLDDSGEYLIVSPADIDQIGYSDLLRDATRLAPMSLDEVLTIAAVIAAESGVTV